uniref:Uncharacterized protein n=1 Tax=Ascaris lumbricoides TaxID=6252 RepID=A0A9J2P041_ASCLU
MAVLPLSQDECPDSVWIPFRKHRNSSSCRFLVLLIFMASDASELEEMENASSAASTETHCNDVMDGMFLIPERIRRTTLNEEFLDFIYVKIVGKLCGRADTPTVAIASADEGTKCVYVTTQRISGIQHVIDVLYGSLLRIRALPQFLIVP